MKQLLLLCLITLAFFNTKAQERWQADLHIVALKGDCEGKDLINFKVAVKNYNDDDTRNVMLTILLPVEVSVKNLPANCKLVNAASAPNNPYVGCVQCKLGNLSVNQTTEVIITTTRSKYVNRFGAFVYGETPDPDPSNNFKELTITCK